jgi:soluble lytic murein transglycosylase
MTESGTGWLVCGWIISGVRGPGSGGQGHRARLRCWGFALAFMVTAQLVVVMGALAVEPAERQLIKRALGGTQDGSWQWAAKLVQGVREPALVTYIKWVRLRDSDERLPFTEYRAFLEKHPDWPGLAQLQARAEEAIDESVPYAARLAFFEGRQPRTRQGRVRLAEALVSVRRNAEANALLQKSWIEDDYSVSEENYFLGLYGQHLRRQDHLARLDRLLWDGKAAAARRMFPLVDKGHQALATARLRFQAAEGGVDGALAAVPAELRNDPGLAFDRLRWRRLKGRDQEARAILLDPPAQLGRPEAWWSERAIQLRRALEAREYGVAYRLAQRHGLKDGASFAEAEWLAGWLALRFSKNPEAALRHFERMAERVKTPISRGRAAYWAGRAGAALGRKDTARKWYREASANPTTFYGQLAAANLGLDLKADASSLPNPTADQRRRFRSRDTVRLALLLCEIGEYERAGTFLNKLASDSTSLIETELVYELGLACRRPELLLRAARAAAREGDIDIRATHPVPSVRSFLERIKGRPEPALLLAVARQESLFDQRAKSSAGALGLMQLMPSTAKAMAKDLGVGFAEQKLLSDPEFNVRLGGHYLGRQIARFDGEEVLAIAAYNAGPSRVAQWLQQLGDPRGKGIEQLVDWIELIPFAETRNYVQRVIENRAVYRLVLKNGNTRTIRAVGRGELREAHDDRAPDPEKDS